MNLKKPSFWDLSKPNLISYLLIPFSIPIILNNFFFQFIKKEKSTIIKTICVGNIYLGGTGKTPLTIKIYEILKSLDKKVATIKKNHSNQKDEQLLLDQKTSLIVSKSRKDAIQQGINQNYDILVFDDGLQETKIIRFGAKTKSSPCHHGGRLFSVYFGEKKVYYGSGLVIWIEDKD